MILGLPDGLRARPALAYDLDAIAHLHDEYWRSFGVDPEPIREFLHWVWGLPFIDAARDTAVVVDDTGVQAYAHIMWDPGEPGPAHTHGVVRPSAWGRGIGAAVLGWLEGAPAARDVGRVERLRTGAPVQDERAHQLFMSRGFARVRTSWDMGRQIGPNDQPLPVPPDVHIRGFRDGQDERLLFDVADTAFRDHWDYHPQSFESFRAEMYEPDDWDPTLAFLAELDGQAVGEVVAIAFADSGYVASLSVLRHARGRGIAKALLGRVFAALAERGFERVELSVDAASPTGAVALYESVGMVVVRESATFDGPNV